MPIKFLFGRREALIGKSEEYKKKVRAYLEAQGYSQTTDSIVEGTFEDMVFYNPTISPGRKYVVEIKAHEVSLTSKEFARGLIKYFRLWKALEVERKFGLMLFVEEIKKPKTWELIFSVEKNLTAVSKWCDWYNINCRETDEASLSTEDKEGLSKFFGEIDLTVGNIQGLELATFNKQESSVLSLRRYAQNLFGIVDKRSKPTPRRSTLIMNILPIEVPTYYYECKSSAESKNEIYNALQGQIVPPFIYKEKERVMLSFTSFSENNPLAKYMSGLETKRETRKLQTDTPHLCSELVNVHLRRIIWNKGVYRESKTNLYYFPMRDHTKKEVKVIGPNGKIWVVKKYLHKKDTTYAKKGEVNFFFHRAIELDTPTYWGISYVQITPRRYYTLDGVKPTDGETRSKIDAKFRGSKFDRSSSRMRLMRFWKFYLFESNKYQISPERWFKDFKFGEFLTSNVDWSPEVIGRNQTRLWDLRGDA